MLRLRKGLEIVDIDGKGRDFDVVRAGARFPLVSFYTRTGNVYVDHGSGDGQQILSSVPVDEWQQRAHEALVSRGWESPWDVCELWLREGFEKYAGHTGTYLTPVGGTHRNALAWTGSGPGPVRAFPHGGYNEVTFNTIEEAHAYLIEQGSESPWEWVPVSTPADDHKARPYVGPEPKPHRLSEAAAALLASCTDGDKLVFECAKFGTVDALRARIAELESTVASLTEKIDKARTILS